MRKVALILTVSLVITVSANGVTGGFGGYYFLGIPIGDSKITGTTLSALGKTFSSDVDMTDGLPYKIGPVNFAVGGIVYFIPSLGVEGGFEMHTGYKNKGATIKGITTSEGEEYPFEWVEKEDNVTWKMNDIYAGVRYTYPTEAGINPVGCGGLLVSMSGIEYGEEYGGKPLNVDLSANATHMGAYFGGGANCFVTPNVAITGLVKCNLLFEGVYDYENYGEQIGLPGVVEYEQNWKRAPYVTTAFGIEYYI